MHPLDTVSVVAPITRSDSPARTALHWRLVVGVGAVAVMIRLVPAVLTYGTSDVMTWELLGRMLLSGDNFYATQLHNWPPLWIYFTAGAVTLHDATGLPFSTLVKLPPIAADAMIAVLLCLGRSRSAWAGLAYALNPVSVLITGYHGQFDSMMLAGAFLAWHLWETCGSAPIERVRPRVTLHVTPHVTVPAYRQGRREGGGGAEIGRARRQRLLASALALGVGIWFKPVPLLLLPVLLPRLASWRERFLYTLVSLAPASLGTLPFFLMWPQDVAANFLGYSSWFGQWGYPVVWMVLEYFRSGTIPWWMPDPEYVSRPLRVMFEAGRWVLLLALGGTWWFGWRRGIGLLRSILATFSVFYFVTNGFGVQYLLWIVPFALAARDRWLWPFTVTTTGLLILAYSLGLAYQPLGVTPDNAPNTREFIVKLASLPAWLVCGLWAWSLLRRPTTE